MAKKVVEELIDDIDGTLADHTVRLGWNNEWRELELSEKNLAALAKGFDRFWDAGRPVTNGVTHAPHRGRSKTNASRRRPTASYDRGAFKSWPVANDVKLTRGRPPRRLVERFLADSGAI